MYPLSACMKNRAIYTILFVVLGIAALQLPINVLAGAKVKFTLFDLFAPISGAFVGSIFGVIAVVTMQMVNLALHGFSGVNNASLITILATLRVLPLVAGTLYFAKKQKLMLVIPLVAIIAFIAHPIGRTVWYYSLFWFVPFLVYPFHKNLLARSLGSTMTAHAAGGALWIWAFNLPAVVWVSLIPVVVLERSIFTFGISASHILMTNLISFLTSKKILPVILAKAGIQK